MKRIAIFCDGTWNRHDAAHPTNVVRLARAVKHTAEDGRKQQVFYVMGVGTGRGSTGIARRVDRWMGGALGWGLDENIEDAYRSLIFCYEPGDEIYIFGFSRGAYTARSLGGLIRSCGIPPREHVHRIGEALERYRTRNRRDTRPNDPASFLFRAEFAPFTATSTEEWNWRQATRPGMCVHLRIAYIGVWDTVGALGVPGHWAASPLVNRRHQFHDTDLSSAVASARHAVALDERRRAFAASEWSNLDALNCKALGLDSQTLPEDQDRELLPYREEWFPGDHGAVGGGNSQLGLAAFGFDWIAQGAMRAGLDLRAEVLAEMARMRDIRAPLTEPGKRSLMQRLMALGSRDRAGPDHVRNAAAPARERLMVDAGYRPGSLSRIIGALMRAGGG